MTKKTVKKTKDMARGVYTVTCGSCGQPTYVHIDDEENFDPLRCRSCKVGFLSIKKGERNNEYIAETSGEEVPDEPEESSENLEEKPEEKVELNKNDDSEPKKEEPDTSDEVKVEINKKDPHENKVNFKKSGSKHGKNSKRIRY